MENPFRWGRDCEFENRVRVLPQHGLHVTGFNTEFWKMSVADRNVVFPAVCEAYRELYNLVRVLNVPTPEIFVYFAGHMLNIRRDRHELEVGRPYDEAKHEAIKAQLEHIAAARYLHSAFGQFLLRAFYGINFNCNDFGTSALWDRFGGMLCPLNADVIAFVNLHGINKLVAGSGIPVDLATMAFERTQAVNWTGVRNNNGPHGDNYPYGEYFRYDAWSGDIEDMPGDRGGGSKLGDLRLGGAVVAFRNGRHINEQPMSDYYRYEALRLYGNDSVLFTFRIKVGIIRCN